MKKILVLSIMMLVTTINAIAQSGEWQTVHQEEDELTGQKSGDVMIFSDSEVGAFICWGFDTPQFRLMSSNGIFNYIVSSGYIGMEVLVGLYNEKGELKEKFNMWLDKDEDKAGQYLSTRNAGTMFNPVGQKKKVKKIFNQLCSGTGYVRIVAERYNNPTFDLKILPYNLQ